MILQYGERIEVLDNGVWKPAVFRGDMMQRGIFVAYTAEHEGWYLRHDGEGKHWRRCPGEVAQGAA